MGADKLKRLAHRLGITRETRRELSDLISEQAIVENTFQECRAFPSGISSPNGGIHLDMVTPLIYTNYFVRFRLGESSYEVNDEFLYRTLHAGDKVRLSYRKIYEAVYDYTDGDYSEKQLIEKTPLGWKLDDAVPLEE